MVDITSIFILVNRSNVLNPYTARSLCVYVSLGLTLGSYLPIFQRDHASPLIVVLILDSQSTGVTITVKSSAKQ